MGGRRLILYLHLVWGTWDGISWITPEIERPIYRCIVNQIQKFGCEVLAINGVSDHVHLVVKFRSTIPLANLVKQAKGVSAKFINEQLVKQDHFRWRVGYGAFTISRWDLPMIITYVKNQKSHHNAGSVNEELE
jgi:putative transposase